eukprot:1232468-Pyramimonas_sp.AAC.1
MAHFGLLRCPPTTSTSKCRTCFPIFGSICSRARGMSRAFEVWASNAHDGQIAVLCSCRLGAPTTKSWMQL